MCTLKTRVRVEIFKDEIDHIFMQIASQNDEIDMIFRQIASPSLHFWVFVKIRVRVRVRVIVEF